MKLACPHCDASDETLLRLILLCEIMRADESILETIVEVFQSLGLLALASTDEAPATPPADQPPSHLRLVTSVPGVAACHRDHTVPRSSQ